MNDEIKEIKIGMYSTDEILEFMTDGEGRGFLGRSMYDAIIDYITNLQEENEHFRTQVNTYENPDDYTLFYMWLDAKAKDKMKQLQEENEILKELNICVGCENNLDYKSRCEKANQYIKKNIHEYKMFNEELGHFSNLTNISIDKNNKVFIDDLLKILNNGDEE